MGTISPATVVEGRIVSRAVAMRVTVFLLRVVIESKVGNTAPLVGGARDRALVKYRKRFPPSVASN